MDMSRARVERVFKQLLNHRRGALDHFAGGDLRYDFFSKHVNRHLVPRTPVLSIVARLRSSFNLE